MSLSALIIDDEQLARDELKYLLDSVGGVDVIAQGTNGIEAVDLIEEHHPDLVFLDVQMPGLDGFAVIKRLKEHSEAKGREPAWREGRVSAADCFRDCLRPIRGAGFRCECGRLPAEAVRPNAGEEGSRAGQDPHVGRHACAGCRSADRRAAAAAQRPQGAARSPQPAQAHRAGAKPVAAGRSGEICFAAIDDGIIRVVTQTFRRPVEVPDTGRTAGAAGSRRFSGARIADSWSTSTTFAKWCHGSSRAISCA